MNCCNKCENNFCSIKINGIEMITCEKFTSKDKRLERQTREDDRKLKALVAAEKEK